MIPDAVDKCPTLPSIRASPLPAFTASACPTSLTEPDPVRGRVVIFLRRVEQSLTLAMVFFVIGIEFLCWLLFALLGMWVPWAFLRLKAFHSASQPHFSVESWLMVIPDYQRCSWECWFSTRFCSIACCWRGAFFRRGQCWRLMRSLLWHLNPSSTFSWSLLLIVILWWCFNFCRSVKNFSMELNLPFAFVKGLNFGWR